MVAGELPDNHDEVAVDEDEVVLGSSCLFSSLNILYIRFNYHRCNSCNAPNSHNEQTMRLKFQEKCDAYLNRDICNVCIGMEFYFGPVQKLTLCPTFPRADMANIWLYWPDAPLSCMNAATTTKKLNATFIL